MKEEFCSMREVVLTKDGSHTIVLRETGVTYHSVHGAIQESKHVFLEAGLTFVAERTGNREISVFEMGFGTGLNAFLTAIYAIENNRKIAYTTVETLPLNATEAGALNYPETLGHAAVFQQLHACAWNEEVKLNAFFSLQKQPIDLAAFSSAQPFDLLYYDAFAPSAQPELWTKEVFARLIAVLKPGGVFVTYCSKGDVRRALLTAGFRVEKLAGPRGKREMVRAWRP